MQSFFSHPIVAALIMLGSLVLFHELGHYIVGRLCGVAVERFAIGFGHTLLSFKRRQTEFIIGWIPLGGYVKFYGGSRNEDVPEDLHGLLYWQAPVWKRALIVAAGPVANFILAFCIFWAMVMHGIERPQPTVGDVGEGSPAQEAGILPGDRFLEIDGLKITNWMDILRAVQRSPERQIDVVIKRGDQILEKKITPAATEGRTIFGSKAKVGQLEVSQGYPNAVVTITSPESQLGRDGLKTGDRIESWTDSSGIEHKIKGLNEIFSLFKVWAQSDRRPILVKAQPVAIKEEKDARPREIPVGEPRSVVLDVGRWPQFNGQSDRSYAMLLGAVDSYLTVGLPRGELNGLLLPGDRLVAWNNTPIKNFIHLQRTMEMWRFKEVELVVLRNFREVKLVVPLKAEEIQAAEGLITVYFLNAIMLGQQTLPEFELFRERNPVLAAGLAINEAYSQTSFMLIGLWQIVTGAVPIKAIGGPIMIAKAASDSARAGWLTFFASMAVISINLGLVNLFPIPLLDGGQLVLLGMEFLKRRPLEESTVENFQKLGFIMVMSLLVLAVYNDLSRFWGGIVRSIFGAK